MTMPQDAQYTSLHPTCQHISAGTIIRVPRIPARFISPKLTSGSEEITRAVKSRFAFYTLLLKQKMQHVREFCKGSLRNINVIANHAVISEKTGCICPINVSARSSNHRMCCLIPVRQWRPPTYEEYYRHG